MLKVEAQDHEVVRTTINFRVGKLPVTKLVQIVMAGVTIAPDRAAFRTLLDRFRFLHRLILPLTHRSIDSRPAMRPRWLNQRRWHYSATPGTRYYPLALSMDCGSAP